MADKTLGRSSVLERMLNLVCSDGHRHFAPIPTQWLGHECRTPIGSGYRCKRKLRRIRG